MIREFELVVECARSVIGASADGRLQKALDGPIDWHYLLDLAGPHRVMPFVSTALNDWADALPMGLAGQLRHSLCATAARNMILTSELHRLLGWLGEAGIQAAPFKGPVLASAVYRKQSLRPFDDLDILVKRRDAGRVRELLCSHGYRAASFFARPQENSRFHWSGELPFVREDGLVEVDLHWELTPRHFPLALDPGRVWQDVRPATVAGKQVLTLSPEDLLIYLCAHGSKHVWQRLVWVCDVASLVRTRSLDWDRVWARARGSDRMLAVGLLLARDLMAADLPHHTNARISRDRHACELSKQMQRRMVLRSTRAAQTREVFFFNWRATARPWLKLRYAAGLVALPAEADWALVRLPGWMFFLHYPLRLARLFVKYVRFLVARPEASAPMS